MTLERIKELSDRQNRHRMSIGEAWNNIDECLDTIESLQKRLAEADKDKTDLLWIVVNVDDHLLSIQSLKRKIDEVRGRMDHELPTIEDVQKIYRDAAIKNEKP